MSRRLVRPCLSSPPPPPPAGLRDVYSCWLATFKEMNVRHPMPPTKPDSGSVPEPQHNDSSAQFGSSASYILLEAIHGILVGMMVESRYFHGQFSHVGQLFVGGCIRLDSGLWTANKVCHCFTVQYLSGAFLSVFAVINFCVGFSCFVSCATFRIIVGPVHFHTTVHRSLELNNRQSLH